jgi:hypothetical protein
MVNRTLMCSVSTIPQLESQAPGGVYPDAHGPGVRGRAVRACCPGLWGARLGPLRAGRRWPVVGLLRSRYGLFALVER